MVFKLTCDRWRRLDRHVLPAQIVIRGVARIDGQTHSLWVAKVAVQSGSTGGKQVMQCLTPGDVRP